MFTRRIEPAFYDTDALGHINNTRLPAWFEWARNDVFRLFTPDLDPRQWALILARLEVEYQAELFYGEDIELRTWLSRLGNSSFTVTQQAWQRERCAAQGNTVLIHYDHGAKRAEPLPATVRNELEKHLQSETDDA
jgi:acyl-CoA thioester hydrolase